MPRIHISFIGILKLLLEKGAAVNIKSASERTALMLGASRGCVSCVKELIAHRADVNVKDKLQGATPIIIAAYDGDVDVAQVLVNASPNLTPKAEGRDVFEWAKFGLAKKPEILEEMLAILNAKPKTPSA